MARRYMKTIKFFICKSWESTKLTTMKYYLMSIKMAVTKMTKDNASDGVGIWRTLHTVVLM